MLDLSHQTLLLLLTITVLMLQLVRISRANRRVNSLVLAVRIVNLHLGHLVGWDDSLVISSLGQGGSACADTDGSRWCSSWLAGEPIGALLTTIQGAALLSELLHCYGWEGGGGLEACFVVVDFVDWDGGVDDGWGDGLLLNHWLNGLVDVCRFIRCKVYAMTRATHGGEHARQQRRLEQP